MIPSIKIKYKTHLSKQIHPYLSEIVSHKIQHRTIVNNKINEINSKQIVALERNNPSLRMKKAVNQD